MSTPSLSLVGYLKSDLERFYHYHGRPGHTPRSHEVWRCFVIPRCLPIALYRISQVTRHHGWRRFAKVITWLNFYLHNLEIASNCDIGPFFFMPHVAGTVLGAERIGAYAVIYHQVTIGAKGIDTGFAARPILGERVFIASGARVIGAITIGDDCRIGANAVVTRSAPANMVLTGVPARAVARRTIA